MRAFLLALSFVALLVAPAMAQESTAAKPATAQPQAAPKQVVDVHGIITAAKQGSPVAQYQLGTLLLSGQGVKQNRQLAAIWFDRAANQGVTDAQWELSKLILDKTVAGGNTAAYKWLLLCSGKNPERIALRDQVEAALPGELVPIIMKQAVGWRPKAETLEIKAQPLR